MLQQKYNLLWRGSVKYSCHPGSFNNLAEMFSYKCLSETYCSDQSEKSRYFSLSLTLHLGLTVLFVAILKLLKPEALGRAENRENLAEWSQLSSCLASSRLFPKY